MKTIQIKKGQFVMVSFITTAALLGTLLATTAHATEKKVVFKPHFIELMGTDGAGLKQPASKKQNNKNQAAKADSTSEHTLPVGGTFWSLFRPVWSRTNTSTTPETAK